MDIRIGAANINVADSSRLTGPAKTPERSLDRAGQTTATASSHAGASPSGPSFVDTLQDAVQAVQGLQADANSQVQQMLATGGEQELHSAIVAVEKADLAFQLMMQVRNKIVQAYQEVSRMPF